MAGKDVCWPMAQFTDPHSGHDDAVCRVLQLACTAELFLPALPPSAAPVQPLHSSCFSMLHYMVSCALQLNLGYIKMKP